MKKVYFTWTDFDRAAGDLAQVLRDSYQIDGIYGIPRGGLILAVVLSHKLDRPLVVNFQEAFGQAMAGKKLLVVDDISDSGVTLGRLHSIGSCTATIHYVSSSIFKPDVWLYEKTKGDWIIYPWEVDR